MPTGPPRRVVALGGGHGLAVTLSALRLRGVEPTAVVSMADDGGSSGRLRRDLGIPPPGDLRMALLALAAPHHDMTELFAYRFTAGELAGHNLGNLALAALADLEGGLAQALAAAAKLLQVRGTVLPSTQVPVQLRGLVDDREVRGQVAIAQATGRIQRVWLVPATPAAVSGAVEAVRQADLVLLGPGSTFTSVVPNLLVPEIAAALVERKGDTAFICNLVAQQGETTGFLPETHLEAVLAHCSGLEVAWVLCQRPDDAADAVREERAFAGLGARVLHADLRADGEPGRHDPERLAGALELLL